jgi:hypothetical protein
VKVIQGQGEINIGQLEGLVQRGIVSKYELIPLTYKEVMTNVKVFDVLCLNLMPGHYGQS